ncbi:MAG TPA: SPFH domain-containing protein, partial [Gammaproteobacteria bacterium]|nr:SPFH domain-containing protein [Gammaproteobacteria bacterium]
MDETEQVIITRFGEVRVVRTTPGLSVKMPFVDVITRLDKRVLRIDAQPAALPDRDKQNLIIDVYARYRITDPVAFRKTLQTETFARSR